MFIQISRAGEKICYLKKSGEYICNNYGPNYKNKEKFIGYGNENGWHNELGPAIYFTFSSYPSGKTSGYIYYLYGEIYQYDEWLKRINKKDT